MQNLTSCGVNRKQKKKKNEKKNVISRLSRLNLNLLAQEERHVVNLLCLKFKQLYDKNTMYIVIWTGEWKFIFENDQNTNDGLCI